MVVMEAVEKAVETVEEVKAVETGGKVGWAIVEWAGVARARVALERVEEVVARPMSTKASLVVPAEWVVQVGWAVIHTVGTSIGSFRTDHTCTDKSCIQDHCSTTRCSCKTGHPRPCCTSWHHPDNLVVEKEEVMVEAKVAEAMGAAKEVVATEVVTAAAATEEETAVGRAFE